MAAAIDRDIVSINVYGTSSVILLTIDIVTCQTTKV